MTSVVKNIVVQLLPIVKQGVKNDKQCGKVLLVKWTHGNFKDRFTGMIKFTEMKTEPPPAPEKLREIAKTLLLPKGIHPQKIKSLELGAILEFTDAPACDEYIFVADLQEDDDSNKTQLEFDKSPCFWFDWDDIPFDDMPEDDRHWYMQVLQEGRKVKGSFTFGGWTEQKLKGFWVEGVDKF